MAVDTATKRFSMINMASPFVRALPEPSGTVDASERQTFNRLYADAVASLDPPAAGGAWFAGYTRKNINRMR